MATGCDWLEVFKAAVLETEWSRVEERIRAAESALKKDSASSP